MILARGRPIHRRPHHRAAVFVLAGRRLQNELRLRGQINSGCCCVIIIEVSACRVVGLGTVHVTIIDLLTGAERTLFCVDFRA